MDAYPVEVDAYSVEVCLHPDEVDAHLVQVDASPDRVALSLAKVIVNVGEVGASPDQRVASRGDEDTWLAREQVYLAGVDASVGDLAARPSSSPRAAETGGPVNAGVGAV